MPLLPDIPRGSTWTEAWRQECEARLVASLPRSERREYFERVAKRRGEPAARELAIVYRRILAESPHLPV